MILLENIWFRYKNAQEHILKEINLEIDKGDFFMIMGPNGSGKSTLTKVMSGVLFPEKGKVSLDGKSIYKYSYKERAKKISFVPQATSVNYPFSVFEVVMMGRNPYLNFWGRETKQDKIIVQQALEQAGIAHLSQNPISELSGGEAQRAFIARALAQSTEVIILDEPNSHLDIAHQVEIFKLLKVLNNTGKTVITISHDMNLAHQFGKNGIFLKNGKIELTGELNNIFTTPNILSIFNVNTEITYNNNKIKSITTIPFS